MDKLPSLPPTPSGPHFNREAALYGFADWSLNFPGVTSGRLFTNILERLISLDIYTPELLACQVYGELEHLFRDMAAGCHRYLCERRDAVEWIRAWWEGAQLAGL